MSDIRSTLNQHKIVILAGAGGFGKSEAALGYAWHHALEYEYVWYFNAEKNESLQSGYRDFAYEVLKYKEAKTEEFTKLQEQLHEWLSKESSYLFIYDNVEAFTNTIYADYLREYFFNHRINGHVIINVITKTSNTEVRHLDVGCFEENESITFLKKKVFKCWIFY